MTTAHLYRRPLDISSVRLCPTTGKRQHQTVRLAQRALAKCKRLRRSEIRYYACPVCTNYHLTSKGEK